MASAWRLAGLVVALLPLPALYALGLVHGTGRTNAMSTDAIRAAHVDAALWEAVATSHQQTLDALQQRFRAQRDQLAAVRGVAQAALADRDATHAHYAELLGQSKASWKQSIHDDPACADLRRPLCPAVAEQLFGRPAETAPIGDP